jgi:glycoprotein-N-acetylgalactosamine 3-beta-galactosyltransferase
MIHTTPNSWSTRAKAVRHTWGPRCTVSIYFYSNKAAGPDHEIRKAEEAVGLDVEHGRGHLTAKTRAGLEYSYNRYGEVADWFMKIDDDT